MDDDNGLALADAIIDYAADINDHKLRMLTVEALVALAADIGGIDYTTVVDHTYLVPLGDDYTVSKPADFLDTYPALQTCDGGKTLYNYELPIPVQEGFSILAVNSVKLNGMPIYRTPSSGSVRVIRYDIGTRAVTLHSSFKPVGNFEVSVGLTVDQLKGVPCAVPNKVLTQHMIALCHKVASLHYGSIGDKARYDFHNRQYLLDVSNKKRFTRVQFAFGKGVVV